MADQTAAVNSEHRQAPGSALAARTANLPSIALREVTKRYRMGDEEILALDGVNLTLFDGSYVAVMGPSGSGKSTLANLLGGLDTPDVGQVVVDGKDLAHMSDGERSRYRNRSIGYIFQSFNLQPTLTALQNVTMPMVFAGVAGRERRQRAEQALEHVGLADRMNHRPTQLSGGQRQRVAIARALVNRPRLILADEPTGNLDSARGQEIMELIVALHREKGISLLVITHDQEVANHAQQVLHLRDGRLHE
ncbi:MAG TPA: ABC transporter ATP-binding protein [Candidatus Dormibacteraeota bacterium]|jgi:putative ABC transport system ATP-binding protein|nr:ABC transporter ATP-binding protein [Candidatus Dormibacteraeota bacterium]